MRLLCRIFGHRWRLAWSVHLDTSTNTTTSAAWVECTFCGVKR